MPEGKKTILIIEDESTLLDMYRLKFEAAGFTFLGASTGEAGLKMLKTVKPDLILTDLMLGNKAVGGKISGFAVIRSLRRDTRYKGVKICALTNLDQEKNIADAYAAGIDDYLVKSDLTPAELVGKVRDILAGKKVGTEKEA